ncbi:hypothetical protein OIU76_025723 [Salix suchowensis]|nr:hypothetical protein OIU77_008709 [Salix suchowensis]KAJ6332707.1 hypothetical protein OIU77_008709 [Salix suchowensis]KAJ6332708.1 hypothetical protein OIU77_008709 [Salix suchowensis]KAJ6376623.1 hypothetical protein OIU76_025723 [Salix suchowensis]
MGEEKLAPDPYVLLMKDQKLICRTQCLNPPAELPRCWSLSDIVPRARVHILGDLPHCFLSPAPESSRDRSEWGRFLTYLQKKDSVGIAKVKSSQFYILPPDKESNFSNVQVAYRVEKTCSGSDGQEHREDNGFPSDKFQGSIENHHGGNTATETCRRHQPLAVKQVPPLKKNYAQAHPSYLETLGQVHYAWIFGAIAELVDNSRDAEATRMDISIEEIYSKRAGKEIPMLSVIDDGHGMIHEEVEKMVCFGHKKPEVDDPDYIGRFGVGFKTGAMRLGRDALVITQTNDSRSIAFLSQSLNEGKDNLEIPIVSYRRKGQCMEVDTSVQLEALAKYNLKVIKDFSPFDKYLIGAKAGLFRENNTGTQIYIWNLDEWGSQYCLEWDRGLTGGSSFHKGDIMIRSRRLRSRPGQISKKVCLDYSLRSYLEVIFLVPRIRIYLQGSLVKSRPLAKYLNQTSEVSGNIIGKRVHLTLGRSQLEFEHANCGIFLYWHGRLIEAYKRVGGMIHNGDWGRGVIGVIDVTDLMNEGNGRVGVLNTKQSFLDCEPYAQLEAWLGEKADEYWTDNFEKLKLKKGGSLYKPDHEWVQCDKCRKWRMLSSGFDVKTLPEEWFCYMDPFNGSCEMQEQKVDRGVITVSAKRTRQDIKDVEDDAMINSDANSDGESNQTQKDDKRDVTRSRRGQPRACKKGSC